jgi:hypothetical protein
MELDDKKQQVLDQCLLDLGQAIEVARRRLRAHGLRSSLETIEKNNKTEIRILVSQLG